MVEEAEFCESKKSQEAPTPVKDDNPTSGFNYVPDDDMDLPFK